MFKFAFFVVLLYVNFALNIIYKEIRRYIVLKEILPDFLMQPLSLLRYDDLCEVRLRLNKPIVVNYKNSYYFLGQSGLCDENNAIICNKEILQNIISKASNYSVYAVNDEIKDGFISVKNGIRIGLAGQVVMQENRILTVKNISSLNIRIPHQIIGSSHKIVKLLFDENNRVYNTLIIGAPGVGKTTILRDLCVQINKKRKDLNLLLLDERLEIAGNFEGIAQLNVGNSTDIISLGKKPQNIVNGIRSMSPDVIIADEIGGDSDIKAIEYAVNCGVSVIASVHSKDIYEFQRKTEFENLIKSRSFKRYVVISQNDGKGTIENIFNEYLRPVLEFIW